jgi:hypothetical protein
VPGTERVDARELAVRRAVALRAGEADVRAEHHARLGEGAAHVVEVAHVRDTTPREVPEALDHREHVGERLQRMAVVAQHVHDRDGTDRRHPLDDGVVVDPRGDDRVVAGHDPHDVLHRLACVQPDLVAARVDGVPPSCTTAISMLWRVRFDGFSKISATPLPSSGRPSAADGICASARTRRSSSGRRR